jgi:hypothetical protein
MQSDSIRGNHRQSETLRGSQRQSEAIRNPHRQSDAIKSNHIHSEAIEGNQRHSSQAIIIGNHPRQPSAHECGLWSTSSWSQACGRAAPWGGRRPSHALQRSPADSRAPSSCACRWRRRGRIDGAVGGLDARVGAHLWGRGRERRGGHLHARLGAHRRSPRTCCVRADAAKGRHIPVGG